MEQKFPPSGRLFKNEYQNSPNAPQLKGDLEVDTAVLRHLNQMYKNGEPLKMEVAGWRKPLRDGGGFFYSLKAQVPYENRKPDNGSVERRADRMLRDEPRERPRQPPRNDYPDEDPFEPESRGSDVYDDEIPF